MYIMNNSKRMSRYKKITKLSAFYIWEPRIIAHLNEYGLRYKSLVCIHTLNPWYEYNVYIAVQHVPGSGRPNISEMVKEYKIVRIKVIFDESLKKIETTLNVLMKENSLKRYNNIYAIPADQLIFDARNKYL